ncbi:hypothetical protein HPT27_12085 [Permianibacter sp. IMCC34836]|uniref:DUF7010 family protein n=1 Tax=Permianibacter fluminis TaxID=2738515 RepID=UPI0015566810|nr:hypothetical protein [Permianibacter fluminis]NQD37767.1 hypothetical protein [Permianibacter fluminis]
MKTLDDLQNDMRTAFLDGAPGMLVSATVWISAAMAFLRIGAEQGIWTLLIGGGLIHPVTTIVLKLIGQTAKASQGNPLNVLAFASTIWLIVCCVLAYGLSRANVAWFFPAMMLTIGSRFLIFHTLFGLRLYWFCGGALIVAGYLCAALHMPPALTAFIGGGLEATFAVLLLVTRRRIAAAV